MTTSAAGKELVPYIRVRRQVVTAFGMEYTQLDML